MNDHLLRGVGELLIRFALCGYREILSICLSASSPIGFGGGMWDLIVPDHCPSFYFLNVELRQVNRLQQ